MRGATRGKGGKKDEKDSENIETYEGAENGGLPSVPRGSLESTHKRSIRLKGTRKSDDSAKSRDSFSIISFIQGSKTMRGPDGDTRAPRDSPEGGTPRGPTEGSRQKGHQTPSGTCTAPRQKQGLADPVVVAREPRRAFPGGLVRDHGGPAGAAHGQGTVGNLRACGRVPHVDLDWLLSNDSLAYGMHGCKVDRGVCLDQGAFVMYDEKYLPKNASGPQMPVFGPLPPQAVMSAHLMQQRVSQCNSAIVSAASLVSAAVP
jgi:hypothetical protein